jgi:hypothetical protein
MLGNQVRLIMLANLLMLLAMQWVGTSLLAAARGGRADPLVEARAVVSGNHDELVRKICGVLKSIEGRGVNGAVV